MIKLCTNCKYFKQNKSFNNENLKIKYGFCKYKTFNYIDTLTKDRSAEVMRLSIVEDNCGKDAKYYKEINSDNIQFNFKLF